MLIIIQMHVVYARSGQVPVLITVLSDEGGSPELKMSLNDQLSSLADELPQLNISFSQVQRFSIWVFVYMCVYVVFYS